MVGNVGSEVERDVKHGCVSGSLTNASMCFRKEWALMGVMSRSAVCSDEWITPAL